MGERCKHNESVDWIKKVAEKLRSNKQQNIEIIPTRTIERIRKMANWKASRRDDVHSYWIKMLVSMQERIAFHLPSFITGGEVPDWMTTSQTVLLVKDKSKGNKVSNFPLMWKLLAGIVADEIHNHLE